MRVRKRLGAIVATAAVVGGVVAAALPAGANLAGSTFESNDGNMVCCTTGTHDWANASSLGLHVGQDLINSQNDNAFGQGTKENDLTPTVVLGSIPNSKADIAQFAVAHEQLASGDILLYLAWTRASQSGTTNFDFELNAAAQTSNFATQGQKTLIRTVGDALVSFDFQGGAQKPTLTLHRWQANNTWDAGTVLGSAVADGQVNSGTIPNVFGQPSSLPVAQFGEMAINLKLAGIQTSGCENLATAFLKSRSSNSFSSEVKDFAGPIATGVNTCNTLIVKKVTVPSPDPTNTAFPFTSNAGPVPALHNGEQATISSNLNPGTYNIAEQTPAGWVLDPANTSCDNGSPVNAIVITGPSQTVTCTFTNVGQGRIIVTKHTDPTQSPKVFTFDPSYGPSFNLTDGQSNDSGLLNAGTYSVSEEDAGAEWANINHGCDNGDDVTAIHLLPGQIVHCQFTNRQMGHIIIHKAIQGPTDTTTAFGFSSSYGPDFTLTSAQTNDSGPLVTGTYNASEHSMPNWHLVSATCDNGDTPAAIHLAAGATVNCTFTNELLVGSISIHKTHLLKTAGGDQPEGNVSFDVTGPSGHFTVTTDANGNVCLDNLFFGDYTVTEQVPPGESADTPTQTITVSHVSYCGDGNGENATFHNTPLTDIHVQTHSEVVGGTSSTIVCDTGATGGPAPDATADSIGLLPGTYHCTVVVDP